MRSALYLCLHLMLLTLVTACCKQPPPGAAPYGWYGYPQPGQPYGQLAHPARTLPPGYAIYRPPPPIPPGYEIYREPAPGTPGSFGGLVRAWAESGAACPP